MLSALVQIKDVKMSTLGRKSTVIWESTKICDTETANSDP